MMKSIRTLVRQDREKYVIPRRVQDVIPIQKIWEDGIFLTGGRYAKSFRFTDINYQVASEPDKEKMFRGYSAIINSLDCGATTKITIFNHRMSQINFEKSILMPMQWDGLDDYREEYNQMLLDKATNGNGIVQEKFITISVRKKDVDAARSFFARVEADLSAHFSALGSTCGPMNAICIWKRRISSRRMGGCRIRMKTAKRLPRRYLIISLACVSPPRKSTPSISGNALILSSV